MFAQAIHNASPRSNKPLSPSTAARCRRQLLESELFGHARGTFTGAVGNRERVVRAAGRRHAVSG
ncbi:sigma 54-interacting transcriptional regulator [Salmonella enterica subsp. enterica]|nr:sigma 54-interacting transcriptional regulator [Salmonella enterica subsp. enterica]